jgi:toxin ParE1/3/4
VRVVWTSGAETDLIGICEHIALDSPLAADRMEQVFVEAAGTLAYLPRRGRPGLVPGTREIFPHENYRLVYEIDPAGGVIWIMALAQAARQWPPAEE